MDKCVYENVNKNHDFNVNVEVGDDGPSEKKLLLRQVMVVSCIWASYIQLGLCAGGPTVIIPQLRANNASNGNVDDELASWISSLGQFCGVPFSIVTAGTAHCIGLRRCYLLVCIATCTSFVILYFSRTITQLLIGEVLQGPLYGATLTVTLLIVVECSSPKYRGIFLTTKSATFFCSIWLANAIGTYFYWKNIEIVGIALSFYNTSLIFAWPESPYWLASKGRYFECKKSHRWLKGTSLKAENELRCLINTQIEKNESRKTRAHEIPKLLLILKEMKSKEFYRPILVCFLILMTYQFSAKMVLCVYVLDIIIKITGSESAAYAGMLIIDGISVFGMYVGSILSRYLKRRTLLLSTTSTGAVFLFFMSLYMYLIKLEVMRENVYASITLLLILSLGASCGPMIMTSSLCTELMPLKLRSLATVIICSFSNGITAGFVKMAPFIFSTLQVYGSFLFFAVGNFVCILLLFKFLPETKDKTLEEIESYFKGAKCIEGKELMPVMSLSNRDNEEKTLD